MRTVTISEARTHLSRLVELARNGEEIVITRAGRPVARLVALDRDPTPPRFGTMRGLFEVPDDFDAPLPPDVLESFYS